jgi:hypothetical protein
MAALGNGKTRRAKWVAAHPVIVAITEKESGNAARSGAMP